MAQSDFGDLPSIAISNKLLFQRARTKFLNDNVRDCPICKKDNVRLASIQVPAKWLCTDCIYEWQEEPPKYSAQLGIAVIKERQISSQPFREGHF